MAPPKRPLELRPYRVAMYAIFLAFTLFFIGCIIYSVAADLYGGDEPSATSQERVTVATCTDEIDVLYRKLLSRSCAAVAPNQEQDWTAFTAEYEKRSTLFEKRCLEGPVHGADADAHAEFSAAAEKLNELRRHLATCGEDGERKRAAVADAITKLRTTVRASGH